MLLRDAIYFTQNVNNTLIVEGFKDLSVAYGIDAHDENLRKAYELFSKNPNVKRIVKNEIGAINGSIEKAIASKYVKPEDFINAVDNASQQDRASADKGKAKEQMNKNIAANESSDYWLIPCKTFNEAKRAAQLYKGNLPTYSFDVLRTKFGIDAPEPATHYKTNKTPLEFLDFMKTAPFFMSPSWCIAVDKDYWDTYSLDPDKDGEPKCWIIISKKWPNVRFCLVGETGEYKISLRKNGEGVDIHSVLKIVEIRDPWQIGGEWNYYDAGKEMMQSVFPNTDKLIENLIGKKPRIVASNNFKVSLNEVTNFKDIDNLFSFGENVTEFKFKSMPKLKFAEYAFSAEKIKEFACDMPSLKKAELMFNACVDLKQFSGNIDNLVDGFRMFDTCKSLEEFNQPMPSLKIGDRMFHNCTSLKHFSGDISSLENGDYMFDGCSSLKHFSGDISSLKSGDYMFRGCPLDKESVKHIVSTLGISSSAYIVIGYGAGELTDKEIAEYKSVLEDKGWNCLFAIVE